MRNDCSVFSCTHHGQTHPDCNRMRGLKHQVSRYVVELTKVNMYIFGIRLCWHTDRSLWRDRCYQKGSLVAKHLIKYCAWYVIVCGILLPRGLMWWPPKLMHYVGWQTNPGGSASKILYLTFIPWPAWKGFARISGRPRTHCFLSDN